MGTKPIENAGDKTTNNSISVGRDSGNVVNILRLLNWDSLLLKTDHNFVDSHLNTSSEVHRVHASGNRFAALFENSSSENRCSSCAVTSLIIDLGGDLFDQGSAHVVVAVLELNIFCHSNTVLCDFRRAESTI